MGFMTEFPVRHGTSGRMLRWIVVDPWLPRQTGDILKFDRIFQPWLKGDAQKPFLDALDAAEHAVARAGIGVADGLILVNIGARHADDLPGAGRMVVAGTVRLRAAFASGGRDR